MPFTSEKGSEVELPLSGLLGGPTGTQVVRRSRYCYQLLCERVRLATDCKRSALRGTTYGLRLLLSGIKAETRQRRSDSTRRVSGRFAPSA